MNKRTIEDVRIFLDDLTGKVPICKSNSSLDGQCVTLIKNLFEFLGVPEPYKARGNAKDVATNYVREGIADNGDGVLRVCVNRNMGGGFGHVWIDLKNLANYESNGAQALKTTKNTRPIQQAQIIVNLDKWLKNGSPTIASDAQIRIKFNETMNIRRQPSLSAEIVGMITPGSVGVFTQETRTAEGYFWRKSTRGNWVATANAERTQGFGVML